MKDGPDIARVASLIGDPARANMLTALMTGKALTATELAGEAGVTLQTASGHLAKLAAGDLVQANKQGRHKYFTLAHADVASALEGLMGLAAGQLRTRTGPKDATLRYARVCYNHLAGEMGVQMFTSLLDRGFLKQEAAAVSLTSNGQGFMSALGIDLDELASGRPQLCRPCLDWSERRSHLAGSLGRALLSRLEYLQWVRRDGQSRALTFSPAGTAQFTAAFPK